MFQTLYLKFRKSAYERIAGEVSAFTRYYDQLIQYQPRFSDSFTLFDLITCPEKRRLNLDEDLPLLPEGRTERTAVLLNGNFNHSNDIEGLLKEIKTSLNRFSRIVVVTYNPYLSGLFALLNTFRVRTGALPSTFVTATDVRNLARLAGFEIVKTKDCGLFPFKLFGLGAWIEKVLVALPLVRGLALTQVIVLRPIVACASFPSLSIVIPARNERGNIEDALRRLPELGGELEVIFAEGHSNDGTWEEIERVIPLYTKPGLSIKALKQTGKGKNNAVREGFAVATKDILTILDADLTMPPELLGRFYEPFRLGLADFVNGSRLVYPMEGEAMRFLNRLGNIFFAKALSFVLGNRLGDSLCGTKLLTRHDYRRFIAWRKDFGDFDPFGDFELLFPASILALGIIDVPIRYRARTYGETKISRFSHGWMLLKMTVNGFFNIKLGTA